MELNELEVIKYELISLQGCIVFCLIPPPGAGGGAKKWPNNMLEEKMVKGVEKSWTNAYFFPTWGYPYPYIIPNWLKIYKIAIKKNSPAARNPSL